MMRCGAAEMNALPKCHKIVLEGKEVRIEQIKIKRAGAQDLSHKIRNKEGC